MAKRKTRQQIGFKQAMEYVLDLLCYAYYVKSDNLVSDNTFDELEKLYCKLFKEYTSPMRSLELGWLYSTGVHVVYDEFKKRRGKKK